jgi:hypothetical protein
MTNPLPQLVELTTALLAEGAVLNQKNTWDISGVVDGFALPTLPASVPPLKLFVRCKYPPGSNHSFTLHTRILDPQGKKVIESGGTALRVGSSIAGEPAYGVTVISCPAFRVATPGDYDFQMFADGAPLGEAILGIHRASRGPGA